MFSSSSKVKQVLRKFASLITSCFSYVDVMKQNNKQEDISDGFTENSPTNDNVSSVPWSVKSNKSRLGHGPSSDCTSMSADSPTSKHSVLTQQSVVIINVKPRMFRSEF